MAITKWVASSRGTNPETPVSAQSIANNAAYLSAEIENATSLDLVADLMVKANFSVAPTVNTSIDLYLVRQNGAGTPIYEDASVTGPILARNGYVGSLVLRAVTGDQIAIITDVPLPPRGHKWLAYNNGTGQTATVTVTEDCRRTQTV